MVGKVPRRGWLARRAAERQQYIFRHSGLGLWMGGLAFVLAWLSILLRAIPAVTIPLGVASVALVLLCLADFVAVAVRDQRGAEGGEVPSPVRGSVVSRSPRAGVPVQPRVTYWGPDEPALGGRVDDATERRGP